MIEKLYIDGIDAYERFGVFVANGGYTGLISFPSLKKVDSNNWPEEDGIEVDLSSPTLDMMEFAIKFAAHGRKTGAFFELLSDGAYHDFDFREIGAMYRLRLVSQPNFDSLFGLELFSLQFANDFPFSEDYEYVEPQSEVAQPAGYELDGRCLSHYGITVLSGSLDEILKASAVKKNLLTNIGSQHGAIYDGQQVIFETKDVRVNCLMHATSWPEFWHNYTALLYDLSRAGERFLFVEATGYEYPCYYKNCSIIAFSANGKIWFEFGLNFVFTSFRASGDEFLLASEDGELIITENGEHIDLG